ncbi:DEAD/DEAH box helicase [Tomitella biformata]|uniref:DEAD/DEAH box helicase n=1 Tax=Tomitella biformata TaxID=630403 RepID=UPI0004B8F74D|nr:SNF2-related protein [Tomitella biformata]
MDETVRSLEALIALGQHVLDAPHAARAEVAGAVARHIEAKVDAAMRAIPVSALRGALPKGTRMGELERSAFRTAADLARATPAMIAAVPGIGPQSALAIHQEAAAQHDRLRGETRLRLDADRKPGEDTEILRGLLTLRALESAVLPVREPLARLHLRADPLRADAARAGRRLSMLFSGKAKRERAKAAVARVHAIMADQDVHALQAQLLAVLEGPPQFPAPWAEYEHDAAAINALLSQFTEVGDEAQSAHGFITAELVEDAAKITLDRTHLRSFLRGYQAFGAQYLLTRGKAILGDEMGLGKTVQALAVAAHLTAKGSGHTLVVCPASVISNWVNETGKHTDLRPWQIHGPERDALLAEWGRRGGVAITTFDTLKALRVPVDPDLLVVDEAHFVKNPATQRAQAVRAVLARSGRAVLMSGTPMENRVEEFKNLVGYVQPSIASRIHVRDGLGGARAFRKVVAPAYLRRNQEDVLTELPDLIEVEDWVLFAGADKAAYRSAVRDGNFMAMRQAAYASAGSAKLERIVEIVAEARAGDAKVLAFSYFRGVLESIRGTLPGTVYGPITGATPVAERQRLVDAFAAHPGPASLLAQIEAGGVGLNIQAASVVILAEPQWKPSTESQAIARAHRMGQVRTVQVHRVLAKDSVDELMRETLARKSGLFDEYARRSHAKESDAAATATGWDGGAGPTEQDYVRAERERLG